MKKLVLIVMSLCLAVTMWDRNRRVVNGRYR